MAHTPRLPAAFLAHGAPSLALEEDAYTQAIGAWAAALPRPQAIAIVSAHWQTRGAIRVTSHPHPPLIYDFSGFPPELSTVRYPAPGAPKLARELAGLLARAGFVEAVDPTRGWDHGAWVLLRHLYPKADVPVVQISLPTPRSPHVVMRMGQALAPVRDEGVVLVGSGGLVHNLSRVRAGRKDAAVEPWAETFDAWMGDRLRRGALDEILEYRTLAPHAELAVPTPEHFDPLFVTLGARMEGEGVEMIFEGFHYGTLSMRSICFSPR